MLLFCGNKEQLIPIYRGGESTRCTYCSLEVEAQHITKGSQSQTYLLTKWCCHWIDMGKIPCWEVICLVGAAVEEASQNTIVSPILTKISNISPIHAS